MATEDNHPLPRKLPASDPERAPLLQRSLLTSYSEEDGVLRKNWAEERDEGDELCPPSAGRHFPHIDLTRIVCVASVAVDHGNPYFGIWNCLFGQQWVLQYLFLVCGVCYGMSQKGLLNYEFRLGTYFVIGICVNWTAWLLMGLDWKSNFFNVVFHLWFIVGLMIYAALLAPLRMYLERVRSRSRTWNSPEAEHPVGTVGDSLQALDANLQREHRDTLLRALVVIGGGVVGILVLFTVVVEPLLSIFAPLVWRLATEFGSGAAFWGLPTNAQESYDFLVRSCTYLMLTCTNIYLIIVCPKIFKRPTLTAWGVLLNTYSHRLLFYRAKDERPFHGLDLMMIALTCYYLGLHHRKTIGEYVIRYWFVIIFLCSLLWPPGAHGRLDENPPTDISVRVRVNLLEAILVICWLVAGERLVHKEIFTEDKLDFLNDWALVVFLVHKAVHIMVPEPVNWVILFLLAPACYLRRNMP